MTNKIVNSELDDLLKVSIFNFEAQIFVLWKLGKLDLDKKINQFKSLLLSSSTTGWVISFCWKQPLYFPSEWTMLARSFIEKIINFIYLVYSDQSELDKFMLHPYYRQFHNLSMNMDIWDIKIWIKYSWIDEYKKIPLVTKALGIFSETNSKLDWSNKNIYKKIEFINNKQLEGNVTLLLNKLLIYGNASEALHWSLYWITNHLGLFDPTVNSSDKNAVYINITKNLILMFASLTFLSNEIFIILNKLNLLDKDSFQELYNISIWLSEPQMNILKSMKEIN